MINTLNPKPEGYEKRFLLFLDILGFSKLVAASEKDQRAYDFLVHSRCVLHGV